MIPLIKENRKQLEAICEENCVAELYVFGSAVTNEFYEGSDLDFAVVLKSNLSPIAYGDAFLGLLEGLKKIFRRNIDLVSYRVVKNPVFKEELDRTKKSLYVAA